MRHYGNLNSYETKYQYNSDGFNRYASFKLKLNNPYFPLAGENGQSISPPAEF